MSTTAAVPTDAPVARQLDWTQKQDVTYAVPLWLRDLQIEQNIALVPGRLTPEPLKADPIAVVCYGPSLNDTWEQVRDFKYIISCSGSHKFLLERGIVPTYHVDVDPRAHKIALMGEPHRDVEYILAATCHPEHVKRLHDGGYKLKLWHVLDEHEESMRTLPNGEWALTGGCSVGLRAMAVARFLGFREMDIFGMDGCEGKSGKHAAAHPNQAKKSLETWYPDKNGKCYYTTPGFLEAARQTPHEMDMLPDVTARFHGEGLVQAIMADYTRRPEAPKETLIAFNKPELISDYYRQQNAELHQKNLVYGVGAGKHAENVKKLFKTLQTQDGMPASVLDYGCGKGFLQKALPFPIYEYDPAIPGKEESPRSADLVCCLDVLEHVEPDKLPFVLGDLRRCVKQLGYFVINTQPAKKTLPDGRNTHLIQQGREWWADRLSRFFTVGRIFEHGAELHVIVGPLKKPKVPVGETIIVRPKNEPSVPDNVETFTAKAPSVALNLSGIDWRDTPYPIGCVAPALDPDTYQQLAASFPPVELFKAFGGGNKWSLSQVNHPEQYHAFLHKTPLWQAFYQSVKAPSFIHTVREALEAHGLDVLKYQKNLKTRFEFSILPADNGSIRPHTDIPSKLVTLVVSMLPSASDWDQSFGGGTDVLEPKAGQPRLTDYKADWSCFNTVHTYPYLPNQCVVFVKTENSWHSVGPMTGVGSPLLRRTLTINIEKGL